MSRWTYLAKHAGVLNLFILVSLGRASAVAPWELLGEQGRAVFEKASPAVVGITIRPQHREVQLVDPSLLPDPKGQIHAAGARPERAREEYLNSLFQAKERLATGLVIDGSGYILTTSSALRDATNESAWVTLADGLVLSATLMARDSYTNLAVLKVDHPFDHVAVFGRSRDLAIGTPIFAITRPYGRSNSLFAGVVSNLGQELGQTRYENLIQTSVPLHPGSIGSPILNFDGEVLGMLSTTQKQSSWPELSFAIPSDMLEYISREIVSHGSVTRGFLGVWVHPLTSKERQKHQLPSSLLGVRVTRLQPQGPAEKAGIQEGDVITHFNGHPIHSYQQLIWQTAIATPGSDIPIEVWRQGERAVFQVSLQKFTVVPEKP